MDKSQYKGIRDIMCGLVFAFVGMSPAHKRLLRSTITDEDIDRFLADIDEIRGEGQTVIPLGIAIQLERLGVKQESERYWCDHDIDGGRVWKIRPDHAGFSAWYSAFTLEELEMLLETIERIHNERHSCEE